jgi:hypothetical protein
MEPVMAGVNTVSMFDTDIVVELYVFWLTPRSHFTHCYIILIARGRQQIRWYEPLWSHERLYRALCV